MKTRVTFFLLALAVSLSGCKPKEEENVVITGQIFIVTKERANAVLGDEKVALLGFHEMRSYLNSRFLQMSNELVAAKIAVETAKQQSNAPEGAELLNEALTKQVELWSEFNWPPPDAFEPKIDITTTDSEGRFKFTVPYSGVDSNMVICAKSKRAVGDKEEQYWWMEVVELKGQKTANYILSNDNNYHAGALGWFDNYATWKWLNGYEAQMELDVTQNDYKNWLIKLK